MTALSFFQDFFRFHRWGNQKLLQLADGLDQNALKASMPLGPGSLRATLIHNIAAQRVWLDRWQSYPSPRFPNGDGWTLEEIFKEQIAIDDELGSFVNSQTEPSLERPIEYRNLKNEAFHHRLSDLLLHVLNHAVHHRAQSVHFLKRQNRTLVGGLDYIFYKIAHPTLLLDEKVAKGSRAYGLEVGSVEMPYDAPSIDILRRYQNYSDWATLRLLKQANQFTAQQLDRDWQMGQGSLRKTLLHIYDAECWWQKNWNHESVPFPRSPIDVTTDELIESWQHMAMNRRIALETMGQAGIEETVHCDFGGGPLRFRVSESMIQLCVHGTLHRAQANNMLRNLGVNVLPIDYVVYLREMI
jgi:uncharacterized damage-inducible protein DinB